MSAATAEFFNETKGVSLGSLIEVAGDSKTRNKGLLGRDGLDEGQGLWIVPCEAIHMFFMRFAIDVVYLDKSKRVVKIVPALKPWRLSACLKAHSVLELPAGVAEKTGTTPGDQLEMRREAA
ncbi:MAG: DUF192 domain-containing protein [Bryobacterales bacterium]